MNYSLDERVTDKQIINDILGLAEKHGKVTYNLAYFGSSDYNIKNYITNKCIHTTRIRGILNNKDFERRIIESSSYNIKKVGIYDYVISFESDKEENEEYVIDSFISFIKSEGEVQINSYSPTINGKVKEFIVNQLLSQEYFVHLLEKYYTFLNDKLIISKNNEHWTYKVG